MDAINNTSGNAKHTPKTTVFNLIILDESGSMSGVVKQTISGCNETLNTIRFSATEHADRINSFVSIFAFQNGGPVKSRYLVKNARPDKVKDVTENDYRPWGNTPLLDAVGSTLTELKAVAATHEDATGIITIITDGYENSSTRYSGPEVARLISSLKELGWTINLIGANVDVESLGRAMNIDNKMAFTQDEEGTQAMFSKFSHDSGARMAEMAEEAAMPCAARMEVRKKKSKNFFKF